MRQLAGGQGAQNSVLSSTDQEHRVVRPAEAAHQTETDASSWQLARTRIQCQGEIAALVEQMTCDSASKEEHKADSDNAAQELQLMCIEAGEHIDSLRAKLKEATAERDNMAHVVEAANATVAQLQTHVRQATEHAAAQVTRLAAVSIEGLSVASVQVQELKGNVASARAKCAVDLQQLQVCAKLCCTSSEANPSSMANNFRNHKHCTVR
jgi:chromosome segregation ATPase